MGRFLTFSVFVSWSHGFLLFCRFCIWIGMTITEEHRHPSLWTRCVCNVWNIILLIGYVGIIIPLYPWSKVCIAFPRPNQQLIVWWMWHSFGRSIGVQRSLHHFLDQAKSTTWTWFQRWTMFFFLSFVISDVCTFTWMHSKKICVCVWIFAFNMRFFEGMHRIRKNWRFYLPPS